MIMIWHWELQALQKETTWVLHDVLIHLKECVSHLSVNAYQDILGLQGGAWKVLRVIMTIDIRGSYKTLNDESKGDH